MDSGKSGLVVLSSRAQTTVVKYQGSGAFARWKKFAAGRRAPYLLAESLLFASTEPTILSSKLIGADATYERLFYIQQQKKTEKGIGR